MNLSSLYRQLFEAEASGDQTQISNIRERISRLQQMCLTDEKPLLNLRAALITSLDGKKVGKDFTSFLEDKLPKERIAITLSSLITHSLIEIEQTGCSEKDLYVMEQLELLKRWLAGEMDESKIKQFYREFIE